MDIYYVVEYKGRFAFIKPFFANNHDLIFSQTFLTPTMIIGIENKLFPNNKKGYRTENKFIERHRISCTNFSKQDDVIQSIDYKKGNIIERGYMVNPTLYLAFNSKEIAEIAATTDLSLTHNECLMHPFNEIPYEMTSEEFDALKGSELLFDNGDHEDSILVGNNRMGDNERLYGVLVGNPMK